ncbi:glycolate oxidase FAD binding subunit [Actinopolymorpha cephalotaxi]|uniref:Glycolate oxidase FAD binding subunit n=1 Tax=Actinopolymorpha cephalotaxi TaxID=504797 RepID=A0A1I2TKB1_9ACTN|nr:FAD-binding oxidoreductase [Actinopolymorpha cephalotaxi]NYH83123.1 glycolate oxidase FAD binding subunit [Actinopolymorpha cephalotaxi]SFG65253.1 glycolate oxidase FAD binding subunit [Actinopolymorpha cephalotaxi]
MSSSVSDRTSTDGLPTVRPADLAQARDTMRDAARAGHRVLVRGAGTAQSWGAPVEPVDVVVDTTGLDRLVAYNPADMTVAVGAGMAMADLQDRLEGQRVALDAARIPAGATVGGLLATGDGGPLRASYGTLRDLVIGVTVVLADGTVARSGGHVIKNVAGYDLTKLFAGSLGSFGLVVEVVLRVHPRPEASRTLAVPCPVTEAVRAAGVVLSSPLEPVAVDWHDDRLLVRFEGTTAGAVARADKARELLGSGEVLGGDTEEAAWSGLAALVRGEEGQTVLRAGTRPDQLPEFAGLLGTLAERHGVSAALTAGVGVGVTTVALTGGSPAGHGAVLDGWRARVLAAGGSVTVHRAAEGTFEVAPAWGPAPATAPLLRSIKQRLDADHRLAPGRFAPWF